MATVDISDVMPPVPPLHSHKKLVLCSPPSLEKAVHEAHRQSRRAEGWVEKLASDAMRLNSKAKS